MRTPEGSTKDKVKAFLKERGAWFTVGTGLATLPVDIIGCYRGRFFVIEVKAPGKKPTPKQNLIMEKIVACGGATIWGDNLKSIMICFDAFAAG